MARTHSHELPSYRLHKPKGLAVVRLNGRDIYLGKYGTDESKTAYERVIAEWLSNGRQLPASRPLPVPSINAFTVNELILAFMEHAKAYYVKNGQPTGELPNLKEALRPVAVLYGTAAVTAFTPSALKAVRQNIVDSGVCRNVVNARVNRIRRMFKWGVESELVPSAVLHALQAVSPLKRGRTDARETKPVEPAPDELIEPVLRVVSRQIAAMIMLQKITGMRPNEVTAVRRCDIDTTESTWVYVPASHKTEHHGRSRRIYLGPRAQAVLNPFFGGDPAAYLFSPADAVDELRAMQRASRKTPMTPSHAARKPRPKPKRKPGSRYDTNSYAYAIARGCERAFPPPGHLNEEQREAWRLEHRWSPNQLRHTAATGLRHEFGIEAARLILGHADIATTMIYADRDDKEAARIMSQVG